MTERTKPAVPALQQELQAQRGFLFGLCYRMTGSAADAEDLVQDTCERALRAPPEDRSRSLRPWLTTVALNLSRDHLRRRKAAPYRGTWLPEPVPTELLAGVAPEGARPDARYDALESATLAFLLALEALSPTQRAVLLLRDVLDYSVRETADALELSESNVKTTLHRARAAMAGYDAARCVPDAAMRKRTERALRRFVLHLSTDNVRGLEALLREDVVALNDPGDEFVAARKPVAGRKKVILFHRKLTRYLAGRLRYAVRDMNGLPVLVAEYEPDRTDFPPRQVHSVSVDARGRIRAVFTIVASPKLSKISFAGLREVSTVEKLVADGVRRVITRLQPAAQRLSTHIQVHAGSRARRKA
ncbi:MAG: sigma-70 family RNA polymerase sigma factor [Polyangiales bacterium]